MHTSAIFHRIIKWLRLEGTAGGHVVQPSLLKQGHLEQLSRAMCRKLLKNSKDGDSTIL